MTKEKQILLTVVKLYAVLIIAFAALMLCARFIMPLAWFLFRGERMEVMP